MSHEIHEEDGGMFKSTPWHRLGTVVGKLFSWADAIAEDQPITRPVAKVPLGDILSPIPSTEGLTLRGQENDYAAVRSDGLVIASGLGEQWTPFHASEGYAFGQAIREAADEDGIQCDLESLGTLYNGRKWFMSFGLGDFYIGDYKVKDILSINGSYDSSWPLTVLSSPTIEVCANTVAAAFHGGIKHYRFKHTSGIFNRVEEAKRAVTAHNANRKALIELGEKMLSTPLTPSEYGRMVRALFPIEDDTPTRTKNVNEQAIETITSLYKAQNGGQSVVDSPGNGWSFVQAVNTYEIHGQPIRKTNGNDEGVARALRQIEQLQASKQPLTEAASDLVLALA